MIQLNTTQVDAVTPEFLRVPAACKYSGFSRSYLYTLMADGIVKSRCIRRPGLIRGTRIVCKASLDSLISGAI